jgi:heme/copper-type cytochrome/quinol oxidase subunit 1
MTGKKIVSKSKQYDEFLCVVGSMNFFFSITLGGLIIMTDRLLDYKGNNLYDASCIAYNANED